MARTKKRDNDELFIGSDRPESHMILEVRQKRRHVADTFDQLKSDYQDYVQKYGKTWLMGG